MTITAGARRSNCKLLGYGQLHQSWYGAIDGAKFDKCPRETQCALPQVTVDKRKQRANHVIGSGLERVAKANGFSLHAGVSCEGHQKDKRERLCRYIARPAVAVPRLSLSSTGKVL